VKRSTTKLYFAADVHGSTKCFRKFINAGAFYGANVLVLGGDITGKSALFIDDAGNGNYSCNFLGQEYSFSTAGELADFQKLVKTAGYYPYVAPRDEIAACHADPARMEAVFEQLMRTSISEWMSFAEERLTGAGIRCFIMAGNDDPEFVDEMLRHGDIVQNPDGRAIRLDDWHEMVSCGYSNRTPWDSPRECDEPELKAKIDTMMAEVTDPAHCVLVAHVPPYNSGLDDAPVLLEGQKVKSNMGQAEFAPAGSTAVRDAITQYGFQVSLHGHIHEAHAIKKVGKTVAINPGSDYGEGTLHGALVTFRNDSLAGYQMVSG
jgi:Icc-related predicted phosphoesterase